MRTTILATAAALAWMSVTHAAVPADQAKKLGAELTLVGAEKAGNKDGTIPAYTGGLTTPPASYQKGSGMRPDPYTNEKPLVSIDAKNMAQHADLLTEGVKGMMKKYPAFRVDVYPTHRTAAFPQFVTDNTLKCAATATTTNAGRSMSGCHAGIPFPIPKDGFQVMWNHLTRFMGRSYTGDFKAINVNSAGKATLATLATVYQEYPYWDASKTSADTYYMIKVLYKEPARLSGEGLMLKDPLNYASSGRRAWQYLPGQRRVKLAPDVSFDTPSSTTGGATTYDDTYMFNGSMERFDFKLIGKKEMYVPYNDYKLSYGSKTEDVATPNHINPDYVRWEKHRVWVVEATLAEGKRHIYSKRVFYIDEDSWVAVATEAYDARGQLYRVGLAYMTPSYEVPAPLADLHSINDLVSNSYAITAFTGDTGGVRYIDPLPSSEWAPDALAGSGIR